MVLFHQVGSLFLCHNIPVLLVDRDWETNIYIIGIDFYDTNYNNRRVSKSYQKNKGVAMKDFLAQHITKTPDVNYTICTNSDWRISLPNLEFV